MKSKFSSLVKFIKTQSKRNKAIAGGLLILLVVVSTALVFNQSDAAENHQNHGYSQNTLQTESQPEAVASSTTESSPAPTPAESNPSAVTQNSSASTNKNSAIQSKPNPTEVPMTSTVPKIRIGSTTTSSYKYIHFQTNGVSANKWLFVITPVKTANPLSTYITESYLDVQPPTGDPVSQYGKGNPGPIPDMITGDEFLVAVCDEAGYLQCGSIMSSQIRMVVTNVSYYTNGIDYIYEYK